MLDHVSLGVVDLGRAATFYDAVLATLGYVRLHSSDRGVQYGIPGSKGEPPFAVLAAGERAKRPGEGFHLAFAATSRAAVDAFHAAAMAHGGVNDGLPGPRPAYDPGYYAAFALDPDGHRVEAVFHETP